MRRYLSYCREEEPRIFRMLDLISGGAQGHGPVHLLFFSAAELGFAWDGAEKGWVRVSLPPLRMMSGPVQHSRSAILDAWRFKDFPRLSERKGFWGGEYADFQGSLQLLTSSHLRERDKMLLRTILGGRGLERIPSWQGQEGRRSLSFFVEKGMVMVTCSGSVPFLPSACSGPSRIRLSYVFRS